MCLFDSVSTTGCVSSCLVRVRFCYSEYVGVAGCLSVRTYVCTYVYVRVPTSVGVNMCETVCMRVYVYVHNHHRVCAWVYVHVWQCVNGCVSMSVYMYVCVCLIMFNEYSCYFMCVGNRMTKCAYLCVCMCAYVCKPVYVAVINRVCMLVTVCLCVCACTYTCFQFKSAIIKTGSDLCVSVYLATHPKYGRS